MLKCLVVSLFALALSGCAADAASDNNSTAACGAVEVTNMPDPPQRVIEVSEEGPLTHGVATTGVCYVVVGEDPLTYDYSRCCPTGWHPLAKGVDGILCEED